MVRIHAGRAGFSNEMVVKFRARHGPAVMQLFDTRTGAERDAVMARKIRNGQPAWAAGLEH
jgi:hypothetical protein